MSHSERFLGFLRDMDSQVSGVCVCVLHGILKMVPTAYNSFTLTGCAW